MSKPMLQINLTMTHGVWVEEFSDPEEMTKQIEELINNKTISFEMNDKSYLTDHHHECYLEKINYQYFR